MNGNIQVKFSELFIDTVQAHGVRWAWSYYVDKHGMAPWEFRFWLGSSVGLTDIIG